MRAGVQEFLSEDRIAVVGVSRTSGFGNTALRELRRRGWTVFPVNPAADVVEGEHCYHSVQQIQPPVNAVLCVVPPEQAEHVVDDCVRAGVGRLWLQQGSESAEAIRRAEAAGMTVIHHACVLMYARPRGFHRFHAWWERVAGRL
jgi:predicted CoA-binding protein